MPQFVPYPSDDEAKRKELLDYLTNIWIPEAVDDPEYVSTESDTADLSRVASAASELILNYAPQAPQANKDEAARRVIGWLIERPSDGTTERNLYGGVSKKYNTQGALRGSGAMALLSPFKVRRAGAC